MQPRFIQILATVILFYGCACVAAADHWNWRDLANAGNIVVGVGAGILTGEKMSASGNGQ